MTEKLKVKEKESVTGVEVEHTRNEATITKGKDEIHVESHVFALHQAGRVSASADSASADFTREAFEGALDKVSRPLKGRFAHVPYTSDDLIREKRAEVELEDR